LARAKESEVRIEKESEEEETDLPEILLGVCINLLQQELF